MDAISGGLYKLTPEQVAGQLAQGDASVQQGEDGVYVFVVMQPDADWQPVGSLARE